MSKNTHLPSQSDAWFYQSLCPQLSGPRAAGDRAQSEQVSHTTSRYSALVSSPFPSPLTCYSPHQHHWPRTLFPKDLLLAMFPAPWKHILTSGSYPQRKGQTLSRGTHDPPKNTLTPTRG